jgi:hypothetical protein
MHSPHLTPVMIMVTVRVIIRAVAMMVMSPLPIDRVVASAMVMHASGAPECCQQAD